MQQEGCTEEGVSSSWFPYYVHCVRVDVMGYVIHYPGGISAAFCCVCLVYGCCSLIMNVIGVWQQYRSEDNITCFYLIIILPQSHV